MKTIKKSLLFVFFLSNLQLSVSQIAPDFEPCIGSGGSFGLNNLRLLLATSRDGIQWTRTGLVISDRSSVADALLLPSGRILVYYVAGCIEVSGAEQPSNHIKLALSDDRGVSWTYSDVQFNNLPSGGTLPVDPNVVLLDNGDIHMLVTIDPDQTGSQKPCTYSAVSSDGGFTFALSNLPVFSVSGTDVLDPENFRFGPGKWKLWTGGIPGVNMLGVSTDEALSFADSGQFCSAVNPENVSECFITADVIQFTDSTFKMYAFGTSMDGQCIRSLSSDDGDVWMLDPDVCLAVQSSNGYESLDVWAPTVIRVDSIHFIMVYETQVPSSASTDFSFIKTAQNDTILMVGDSMMFTARTYFNDNTLRDVTFFGDWNSSNQTVAEIDEFGKLNALSSGETYVYKTYESVNSDSVKVTVYPIVGYESMSDEDYKVDLFPVPAADVLFIRTTPAPPGTVMLKICNSMGAIVLSHEFSGTNESIDMKEWSPGFYYAMLEFQGVKIYKRIIRQ